MSFDPLKLPDFIVVTWQVTAPFCVFKQCPENPLEIDEGAVRELAVLSVLKVMQPVLNLRSEDRADIALERLGELPKAVIQIGYVFFTELVGAFECNELADDLLHRLHRQVRRVLFVEQPTSLKAAVADQLVSLGDNGACHLQRYARWEQFHSPQV